MSARAMFCNFNFDVRVAFFVQSPNFSLSSASEARRKHAQAWTLYEEGDSKIRIANTIS